ncbi:hypothetical protein [Sorangium sp. So ce204]|uniref:hypothetical protein n=1 Tax=Sorangium sp. So ce204 TaxID=3133288 RepID=UPI003F5E20BB
MYGYSKWTRLSGDGREEAFVPDGVDTYVPVAQVRGLSDVTLWLSKVAESTWAKKEHVVELAILLIRHVEGLQELEAKRSADKRMAARNAESLLAGAAARAAAGVRAQRLAAEVGSRIQFGTKWGKWTYENTRQGPSVVYNSGYYSIECTQIPTPEEVGHMVEHLTRKDWLDAQDIADAVEALVACFADASCQEVVGRTTDGLNIEGCLRRVKEGLEAAESVSRVVRAAEGEDAAESAFGAAGLGVRGVGSEAQILVDLGQDATEEDTAESALSAVGLGVRGAGSEAQILVDLERDATEEDAAESALGAAGLGARGVGSEAQILIDLGQQDGREEDIKESIRRMRDGLAVAECVRRLTEEVDVEESIRRMRDGLAVAESIHRAAG